MRYEFKDQALNRHFILSHDVQAEGSNLAAHHDLIQFNWNRSKEPIPVVVDGIEVQLAPQQLTTFTYHHHVEYPTSQALSAILFNRDFYCIADHDHEIGCNGILFFGTQDLPIIQLDEIHQRKMDLLWQVMIDEFGQADRVQGDMLQMLLKRFIILCTRLAKSQLITSELASNQLDIVRQYNVLVDTHFRTKKQVREYADLLHRSPKTLSNLFAKYGSKSPLQLIKERTVLEAKRLLYYTDKQVQEIAYELGFEAPEHFSKYFKSVAGTTPGEYKLRSKQQDAL